jgi:hypothetical protein
MPFATSDDVATRLGRDLTAAETAMAEQVIDMVTGLIVDEVDRDLAWATALDPVPVVLKALCVDKVIAVGANPNGLRSNSQTLGQASYSKSFRDDAGLWLTPQQARLVRQAVYGSLSGSSTPRAMQDRLINLRENRDVDEEPDADDFPLSV